jgi:hypothetical protein
MMIIPELYCLIQVNICLDWNSEDSSITRFGVSVSGVCHAINEGPIAGLYPIHELAPSQFEATEKVFRRKWQLQSPPYQAILLFPIIVLLLASCC